MKDESVTTVFLVGIDFSGRTIEATSVLASSVQSATESLADPTLKEHFKSSVVLFRYMTTQAFV
jgi:hypothetical protein